jgi:cytochrome c oxidase cbb3-type subunit III
MNIVKRSLNFKWLLLAAACFTTPAFAAGPPQPSALENPLAQALLIIMVLLALVIAILASVVNGAVSVFREKMRTEKEKAVKNTQPVITTILVTCSILLSYTGMAQEKVSATAVAPVINSSINGLSPLTFYSLVIVMAVEILIIIALVYILKWLMGVDHKAITVAHETATVETIPIGVRINKWWNKLNRSIAIDKEKDIDLNHEYDGIRELDNSVPPWWMFGFVFFILFGFGYLYRYHVAKSAPLQLEELQIAMEKAEVEKEAYLKLSANNIDENSVTKLDENGIASGKSLFTQNCVACHGPEGQGNAVGPNLADTYWLHGGDIKDVFKTIKYGWPDKGMRSWKEDFSPVQIAELASFVKSLAGTNPANAKEPQGELFNDTDENTKADSSSTGDQAKMK